MGAHISEPNHCVVEPWVNAVGLCGSRPTAESQHPCRRWVQQLSDSPPHPQCGAVISRGDWPCHGTVRPALAHPALLSAAWATLPPRATVPSCEPGLRRTDSSSGEARGTAWDDVSKQELATYSGDTIKYHLMYTSRLQVGLTWLLWP